MKLNQGENKINPGECPSSIMSQFDSLLEGVRPIDVSCRPVTNTETPPHSGTSPNHATHGTPGTQPNSGTPGTQPDNLPAKNIPESEEERSAVRESEELKPVVIALVTTKEEDRPSVDKEHDEVERHIKKISAVHARSTSPLFPGIPHAVPHTPDQCESADCVHKMDTHSRGSYTVNTFDSFNLNESRADDSTESECETENAPKCPPQQMYMDPADCVPKLNLGSLPESQTSSGSSSARSDSLEYWKNIFGPYQFINPYYLSMNPFHSPQVSLN